MYVRESEKRGNVEKNRKGRKNDVASRAAGGKANMYEMNEAEVPVRLKRVSTPLTYEEPQQ